MTLIKLPGSDKLVPFFLTQTNLPWKISWMCHLGTMTPFGNSLLCMLGKFACFFVICGFFFFFLN